MGNVNYDRLIIMFQGADVPKEHQKFWIENLWELFNNGDIRTPEDPFLENKLMDLLKEYNLESLFCDFRFMGIEFCRWVEFEKILNKKQDQKRKIFLELVQALNILYVEKGNSEIEIKSKIEKKSFTIQDTVLIEYITKKLFEYFKNIKPSELPMKNQTLSEDVADLGIMIEKQAKKLKTQSSVRGRKNNRIQIKKSIFYLQNYLQKYTELKAESESGYSNAQARFIFRFLEIHGLIPNPNLIARKEDIIGYYFKDFSRVQNPIWFV